MEKASEQFKHDLKCVDWAMNGNFLIVGDENGYVHAVDANTLKATGATAKANNADKRDAWVQDVKIAPNCKMLAFGTHGGLSRIELVKIADNGKKLQKVASVNVALSSALTHLDWSSDSGSVVVNSQAYELMWIDANSQQRISASGAKDIDFHSWSCILGFPVQGIWPGPDYTDVNSVCRSHSRQTLVTGEDSGKVKLFRFPCVVEGAGNKEYIGHSSHVTRVKLS